MNSELKIVLFALSTCPACSKTRELLDKNNVDYLCVYLDTIDPGSRYELLKELHQYNPAETFPTIVINGGDKIIIGYGEEEIRRTLGLSK